MRKLALLAIPSAGPFQAASLGQRTIVSREHWGIAALPFFQTLAKCDGSLGEGASDRPFGVSAPARRPRRSPIQSEGPERHILSLSERLEPRGGERPRRRFVRVEIVPGLTD